MKFKYVSVLLLSVLLSLNLSGQRHKRRTDANLFGHVVSEGEHLPFVAITIEGTIIGTTTDETGHYTIYNLPRGKFVVQARSVGYKPLRKEIILKKGKTFELNFELEKDVLGLAEVVVTGDRNEKNRKDAAVIVNTLTPKLFNIINPVTLNEGLNFTPGLRMEYNCQNCGFSQVRMNGMEGPYSQILINGRPIFSGLAGVYGLELIPANMLERIEVVRGGGSALYGSNAIAGTINLILKDPIANAYEGGFNGGASGVGMNGSGEPAMDYSVNANASVISGDSKTGLSLYGFYRNRNPFDANGDGFSELTKINNTTFGTRFYHRFGLRTKISADFFNIKEERRGGDMFDYPKHEAGIAEAVDHNITTGAVTLDHFTRGTDLWSTYFSAQQVLRDSYYGAGQSLQDYGNTKGLTYTLGTQYNAHFDHTNVTVGVENREEWLTDQKLGYPDFENAVIENGEIAEIPHTENTLVADQRSSSLGGFAQIDVTWNKLNVSAGGRFDHYTITNVARESVKKGNVFSPRLTLKYDIYEYMQARVSYSQGYRAPQIFDEDLHIETSGSRQVLHQNDPALKQETSHSYIASIDLNKKVEEINIGFLAEGFYTRLNDAFVNEYGEPDENGVVVYTRKNSEGGATVKGINLELNLVPQKAFLLKAGYTFQTSEYDEIQEFDEFRFFRTPDQYGFLTIDWQPLKKMGISATAKYTGKMLVPYFGPRLDNPEAGMLVEISPFIDLGLKARYNIKLNGATLQVFAGVKNLFNAYQGDFDEGIERDPGYVYGPGLPRTMYAGLKIGSMLK
jgi:outer membrane receptor for ferrienterochelin and colicins